MTMDRGIYAQIKELPNSVLALLTLANFHKKEIQVRFVSELSISQGGGDGRRSLVGFAMLDGSREPEINRGSWGGANPFEAKAPDCDHRMHTMVIGSCVFIGSEGYGPTHGVLYIHPENAAKFLPEKGTVTDRELMILEQFKTLTSAGRKNEWARYPSNKPTDAELDSLVCRGLLSRNRAGAMAITTAGRNAR